LDLSDTGAQPMVSADGNLVICFNGEIYNHAELREAFGTRHVWRGQSDTETLIELIATVGVEEALRRSRGMFAFALWDRTKRELLIARDRLGEKPLYYSMLGSLLLFGSELRALRVHERFPREVDPEARSLFFRLGYIPAPWTVWRDVHKVHPAEIIRFAVRGDRLHAIHNRYWSLEAAIAAGAGNPIHSPEDAVEALGEVLSAAVQEQMQADVAVGAFLSGGIDSALIVSMATERSRSRLKTFTIGNSDERFDESAAAQGIATRLGTEHTVFNATARHALDIAEQLPSIYDEPLADSSAIPTLLVARLASRTVKVVLSGDGGDEFFGGYRSYINAIGLRRWRRLRRIPPPINRLCECVMDSCVPATIDRVFREAGHMVGVPWRHSVLGWCSLARALMASPSIGSYFRTSSARWLTPPLHECRTPLASHIEDDVRMARATPARVMMAIDASGVLPGDILAKVDRAAMSVGLETRAPLLDVRVIELALRMPTSINIQGGVGKRVLRESLTQRVGPEFGTAPKRGFSVPIGDWLRGPFRSWSSELLSPQSLGRSGAILPSPIRARWESHLNGEADYGASLWTAITWVAWERTYDGGR
jgi:asparagine synthase (glutamine-hydrolysing)